MDEKKLIISSSPHIRSSETTSSVMLKVLIALIPATVAGIIFFKVQALITILLSVLVCLLVEGLVCYLRKKPMTLSDGSALVTGLLLALTLPPSLPLYMTAIGAAMAMIVGKHVYGGIGKNPFNPALVGRAFLAVSFSVEMTTWISPDGITSASPLGLLKMSDVTTPYMDMFLGNIAGSIGETSALAILIGGIFLIVTKVIDWEVPTLYLGSVAVIMFATGNDPLFHLLSGGLCFGAFFMATDYVSTPLTKKGKAIFALGCGILTAIIRLYGGYPEGTMFAILIMNCFTPIINRFTVPKMYGRLKADAQNK